MLFANIVWFGFTFRGIYSAALSVTRSRTQISLEVYLQFNLTTSGFDESSINDFDFHTQDIFRTGWGSYGISITWNFDIKDVESNKFNLKTNEFDVQNGSQCWAITNTEQHIIEIKNSYDQNYKYETNTIKMGNATHFVIINRPVLYKEGSAEIYIIQNYFKTRTIIKPRTQPPVAQPTRKEVIIKPTETFKFVKNIPHWKYVKIVSTVLFAFLILSMIYRMCYIPRETNDCMWKLKKKEKHHVIFQ